MEVLQPNFTPTQNIQSKISELVSDKNGINTKYNSEVENIQNNFTLDKITSSERDAKMAQTNASRIKELDIITNDISTLEKQKDIISKDIYKNVTKGLKTLNSKLDISTKDILNYKSKLKNEKISKLSANVGKNVVSTISARLTDQLTSVGSQNKKIESLVDSVNEVIDNIVTKSDMNNAKILRNNALNIINSNQRNILSIRSTLSQLNSFVTIFNLVIQTLSSLPIPLGAPLGVGVPMNVVLKVVKQIENANKLVLGLNVILSICIPVLTRMIQNLEELKSKLQNINDVIDDQTVSSLTNEELQSFLSTLTENNNNLGEYKDFKFVLKEENDPAFVVAGNKRHYAVAIDLDGLERVKSEYSFTLNPQVLVDQLKLIIDNDKLTA